MPVCLNSPASASGFIHSTLLDGRGGARGLTWEEVQSWNPASGILWLHVDYTVVAVQKWVREKSDLKEVVADALLSGESRPRAERLDEGLILALRGVNLNPASNPEDMVSVRLWVEERRIISSRKRSILSIRDILDQLALGKGPRTSGEFITELAHRMVWRMGDTVDAFEEKIAKLEEKTLLGERSLLRNELAALRKQTIGLRRYLAPEREALAKLMEEKISWFDEANRVELREVSDKLIRHIEDVDAVRERAAVTQDELQSHMAEQLNNRMYVLSIIAAIFMPLGFLTGLLGINVGGIPGAEKPNAFYIFVGILMVVVMFQLMIFKKNKWL